MARRENQTGRVNSPVPEDPFHLPLYSSGCVQPQYEKGQHRRALSPSILPGVRPIPRELSESIQDQLIPGNYYAKSMTQHLGPFDHEPTKEELPSGDIYFIMQSMGRISASGKCIFRSVKQLVVPAKGQPAPRPISPSELPGIRKVNNQLNDEIRNDVVPGHYFAKSMTRCLGPFRSIPTHDVLPSGESYVILQEMGNYGSYPLFRRVTQIDR